MSTKVKIEANPKTTLGRPIVIETNRVDNEGKPIQTGINSANEPIYQKQITEVIGQSSIPGTTRIIAPRVTSSGLKTGLEGYIDNPYIDYKESQFTCGNYGRENAFKMCNGKDKIRIQDYLEIKHDTIPNYYTNNLKPDGYSSYAADVPFFAKKESKITIPNNTVFLDLANPIDEVHYYVLLSRDDVAKSYSQLEEDPQKYKWYISDEGDKDKFKADKTVVLDNAIAILVQIRNKANSDGKNTDLQDLAIILGSSVDCSVDKAYNDLRGYIVNSDINLAKVANFMKYANMLSNGPAEKAKFKMFARLEKYLAANLIRVGKKNKLYYSYVEEKSKEKVDLEWTSKEHAVHAFLTAKEYEAEVKDLEKDYQEYLSRNVF